MVKNLNILIVDDDVKDRKLFKQQIHSLNHYSYKINESNGIIEAEEFLRKDSIDLLFIASNIKGNNSISNICELHKKFSSVEKILLLDKKTRDNESYDNILDEFDYLIKGEYDNHSIFKTISSAIKKKQMLAEFVTSKNFFRSAVDSLSASIAILDENGIIIFVNKAWRDFAFNNNANMINDGLGLNYIKIAENSTDEDGIGKQVAKAAKEIIKFNSDEFYIEYPCNSDTEKRWFALRLSSFEQNSIRRIVASHENITIRKEAEEKLKTSDKVFRHSIDMLCIAGFDGYFKVLNPAWSRVLGWSEEELLSKPWTDFVHPNDIYDSENAKSEIVAGKEIYQFENRYICKDGSIKWLSWATFPYPEENIMFGVARDVTDKLKRDELIKTMERAIEQSPVSIMVTDPHANVEFINPKYSEASGYSFKELVGKNPNLFNPEFNKDYIQLWSKITSGEMWEGILQNTKKDGTLYWENIRVSPIYNSKNKITHFVAIKEDISDKVKKDIELKKYRENLERMVEERTEELSVVNNKLEVEVNKSKEAERAITKAFQRERELNNMKTQFVSMASHEFRTPLTTIQSSSELIEAYVEKSKSENVLRHVNKINYAIDKMTMLLDEVLTLSRVDRDIIKLNIERKKLKGTIDAIIDESAHRKKASQKFIIDCNICTKEFKIDSKLLNHILTNLIINAFKYSYDDSTIKLRVSENKEYLIFIVEDNGTGIKKENLEKVFETFFRGENTSNIEGSGLGLSIVKKLVEIYKGQISIESEISKGTKVYLKIPKY